MTDWMDVEGPAEDWDRAARLRNRLSQRSKGETAWLAAAAVLVAVGVVVALLSVQVRLGLDDLFSSMPGLFIGMLLAVVGLAIGAAVVFRMMD